MPPLQQLLLDSFPRSMEGVLDTAEGEASGAVVLGDGDGVGTDAGAGGDRDDGDGGGGDGNGGTSRRLGANNPNHAHGFEDDKVETATLHGPDNTRFRHFGHVLEWLRGGTVAPTTESAAQPSLSRELDVLGLSVSMPGRGAM